MEIGVKLLTPGAVLPSKAYEGDAAFDLCSTVDLTLAPQERATVPTGLALVLPPHVAALTVPRSGLAATHGVTIVNAPGLIDPGYRGEIRIVLLNTDRAAAFHVAPGDRIAQLLFVALTPVTLVEVGEIDDTHRGERGFGSSGQSVRL